MLRFHTSTETKTEAKKAKTFFCIVRRVFVRNLICSRRIRAAFPSMCSVRLAFAGMPLGILVRHLLLCKTFQYTVT